MSVSVLCVSSAKTWMENLLIISATMSDATQCEGGTVHL